MNFNDFKAVAIGEMSNRDTLAIARGVKDGSGIIGEGAMEVLRWMKAREAFPQMSLTDMWATDRALGGNKNGRPQLTELQRLMLDPAWMAVDDLEFLKGLWRELMPGKKVPLEKLTDIVVSYRDVDRSVLVARRNRPKSRLLKKQ